MYQIDAFATRLFEGNPAAVVVLNERWLDNATMQAIASENNLAETAFVRPNGAGWELRWFTPVHEVEFCGHATLATAHALASELGVVGHMRFDTRVGQLRVGKEGNMYRLDVPAFLPHPIEKEPDVFAEIFAEGYVASFRNFENLFVELPNECSVANFIPNLTQIAELAPAGLAITAAGDACDFVSRYFVPAAGIPEDPATGSTHATLAPYWSSKTGRTKLRARQLSARGGHFECEVIDDRVIISGGAVTFMKGSLRL